MKSFIPHAVDHVPLEMFSEVRQSVAKRGYTVAGHNSSFDLDPFVCDPKDPKIAPMAPLFEVIQENEQRVVRLAEITLRIAWALPGEVISTAGSANGREKKLHRDGNALDTSHRYVTSDALSTEFGIFGRTFAPGAVVRFDRARHRSPRNRTDEPILRTWIRTTVFF